MQQAQSRTIEKTQEGGPIALSKHFPTPIASSKFLSTICTVKLFCLVKHWLLHHVYNWDTRMFNFVEAAWPN
jgi:hemerythrin